MLRLVVDLNRCQGYAQCAFLAPDVFAMHGDEGLLYDPQAEEAQRERIAQAVAACPVQAILVDELDMAAAASAASSSGASSSASSSAASASTGEGPDA